jgi:hypothetical protein
MSFPHWSRRSASSELSGMAPPWSSYASPPTADDSFAASIAPQTLRIRTRDTPSHFKISTIDHGFDSQRLMNPWTPVERSL